MENESIILLRNKTCLVWVVKMSSFVDQKQRSDNEVELFLTMFKSNISIDQTWIHHFTLKSKRLSSEEIEIGERQHNNRLEI